MRLSIQKSITPLKEAAKAEIDRQAGEVRRLWITVTPGQEMVYQEKRSEALAIVANPEINPSTVPHLASESVLMGETLFDYAVVILTLAEQWKMVSAAIENIRLTAKRAVDDATNPALIDSAQDIDWTGVTP